MQVKARPQLASARLMATWNTGRNYTHNGQRIAVFELVLDDGRKCLLMRDYDRQLNYQLNHEEFDYDSHLRQYVMNAYDYGYARNSDPDFYFPGRHVIAQHPVHTMQFRAFSF